MVTLSKRATPSQAMILRIVEGAVKNTCDAHGEEFNPSFARSVAKRAAGTLSAEMSAVLAAKPSEKLGASLSAKGLRAARAAYHTTPLKGSQQTYGPRVGKSHPASASPLRSLEKWMFRQMRDIKNSGRTEYADAFIAVLRQIAKIEGRP